MQISEIMTRDPVVAPPDTMLRVAARMMRDLDSGALASPAICRTRSTAGRWSSGPCASSAGGTSWSTTPRSISRPTGFDEITPEQLDQTFRTNIYAYLYMAQAALPHLSAGDVIINTGSVVAMRGHPQLPDYAATKAAIHNLTRSLAFMLTDRGIRVNCVAPGPVWTPLIAATRSAEKVGENGVGSNWNGPRSLPRWRRATSFWLRPTAATSPVMCSRRPACRRLRAESGGRHRTAVMPDAGRGAQGARPAGAG